MTNDKILFCFGMGFAGGALGRLLLAEGWSVIGTARDAAGCNALKEAGFEACLFTGIEPGEDVAELLASASHVLNSVPPGANDPVLTHHGADLKQYADQQWFGLLSTVGVYGEHHGGWVDEDTKPKPIASRSLERLKAEQDWQAFFEGMVIDPHIFRLSGIYGPGRNQLEAIKRGKVRSIVKQGQVFNRVHVEDIAQFLYGSMLTPKAGHVFNISDDEPSPSQDVVSYACELLGIDPLPEVKFEEADLSPMARSFYGECKRVRNDRIKRVLRIELKYPTYREGLIELSAAM
ncbi:MAG: SDR family oxidoreductase [bacterium]|nr:SDR family oxidoreductase [bacterium]